MRKKLWGCAVAAAMAALGGGLAVNYACDHPDSWLGRCFVTAHGAVASPVTALQTAARPAEVVVRGVEGLFGRGTGAVCEDPGQCRAPEAGAAVKECPAEPAVLPGGVAMHQDEEALPAQPMPPIHDLVGALPAADGAEECEEAPMPRAEDDAALMPRADEDCYRPEKKSGPAPSSEPAAMPGCKGDDHHGSGPHTSKGKEVRGGTEECESVVPRLRRDGGESPRHPDVDTMEVRPSDLRFLDFTGPF